MITVIGNTLFNENGDCDGMGIEPIIIIKHSEVDVGKIEQIAEEFTKLRNFYNRVRLIQQGLYVYGPTDAEKDRAEKLNEEGISLLPEREDRLSVWAKNYFINRAFVMGISMDIMQVDDVVSV